MVDALTIAEARAARWREGAKVILDGGEPASHRHIIPAERITGDRSLTECLNLFGELIDLRLEISVNLLLPIENRPENSSEQTTAHLHNTVRAFCAGRSGVVECKVSHDGSGLQVDFLRMATRSPRWDEGLTTRHSGGLGDKRFGQPFSEPRKANDLGRRTGYSLPFRLSGIGEECFDARND